VLLLNKISCLAHRTWGLGACGNESLEKKNPLFTSPWWEVDKEIHIHMELLVFGLRPHLLFCSSPPWLLGCSVLTSSVGTHCCVLDANFLTKQVSFSRDGCKGNQKWWIASKRLA